MPPVSSTHSVLSLVIFTIFPPVPIDSILTSGPSDVLTITGSDVTLQCVTNLTNPVMWQFSKAGAPLDWKSVYQGDPAEVTNSSKYKVTVDSSHHQYNLTVLNTRVEDSGTYRCSDDHGLALWKHDAGQKNYALSAQLIVVDQKFLDALSVKSSDSTDSEKSYMGIVWLIIGLLVGVILGLILTIIIILKCSGYKIRCGEISKLRNDLRKLKKQHNNANGPGDPANVKLIVSEKQSLEPHNENAQLTSNHSQIPEVNVEENIEENGRGESSQPGPSLPALLSQTDNPSTKSKGFKVERTLLKNDDGIGIAGVIVVDNKIYVVQCEQPALHVFNSENFRKVNTLTIEKMKEPLCLAGCSKSKALYISDWTLESILRFNIEDNEVSEWKIKEGYEPRGLSVTSEYNLIVTVEVKVGGVNKIMEYTSDRQLIREISVEGGIKNAWMSLKTSSCQFLICHGFDDGDLLHRVSLIDSEQHIVKSYGGKKGKGGGQMNEPRFILIDKRFKRIFVTDYKNGRILELSEDLKYLGEIKFTDELKSPACLHYEPENGRMFVGDAEGGLIVLAHTTV